MGNYAILNELTQEGVELFASNPTISNNMVIQADYNAKNITNYNYGISYSEINYETGLIWHEVEPLTATAKIETGNATMGIASAGFLSDMKNMMSYAIPFGLATIGGAILGAKIGAVIGTATGIPVVGTTMGSAIGFLVGGIIGGIIGDRMGMYSFETQKVELQQTLADNLTNLDELFAQGLITREEWERARDANKVIITGDKEDKMGWEKYIVWGMVGAGLLVAFNIYLKRPISKKKK